MEGRSSSSLSLHPMRPYLFQEISLSGSIAIENMVGMNQVPSNIHLREV